LKRSIKHCGNGFSSNAERKSESSVEIMGSHADADPNNYSALNWLVKYLELNLVESEVRWASYSAKLKEPSKEPIHLTRPSRPSAYCFGEDNSRARYDQKG
jgi:hypothetical protein